MRVMAHPRKPYTFAKRGITRELMIQASDSFFWLKLNFQFMRVVGDHVEFRYRVDKVRLDVMEEFKKVSSVPGNAIYVASLDFHEKFAISERCAVEVENVEEYWEPTSSVLYTSGGKKYSTTFNPTDKEHFKAMLVKFEEFIKNHKDLHQRLKVFMDATAVKARGEIGLMMGAARKSASNETLRKAQRRQASVYENGEAILNDIFKGVGGQWHMYHGAGLGQEPNTDVSVSSWEALKARQQDLFIPPFIPAAYVNSAGQKVIHAAGTSSFLLTFGMTPYPFAVLYTGDVQPLGSMYTIEKPRGWAIAKIKGAFHAQEIRVDHRMEEDKLEMACLLAIGAFMKGNE